MKYTKSQPRLHVEYTSVQIVSQSCSFRVPCLITDHQQHGEIDYEEVQNFNWFVTTSLGLKIVFVEIIN